MDVMNIIVVALISVALIFFAGTAIGIVRFPDFYSRLHAAGKGDTLSTIMLLAGLALYHLDHWSFSEGLVALKIMLIGAFVFFASPTATHAIVDAGYEADVEPWQRKTDDES